MAASGDSSENVLMQEVSKWQADTASEDIFVLDVSVFNLVIVINPNLRLFDALKMQDMHIYMHSDHQSW